ncbi:hypothetical protein GUITHDRAFT_88341 [Guillardia theta CCMP2712]|uniref:tRNA pseudouridine(55) synthase n=1 Tax=Guillardia theta (strain CCMP2712) TaxID=905079 RepID=L1J0F3_GUITC|nr:hypothetical protein GUITHDRAFT_88341 [Guillardia theta CCMP2712]EKX41575.1 hypothetical protein GUITHDRAFT_88341 [Guillardia theta CCMP2712]|eukprot:XP_005828555.1 hypothetical protein GUITHDRAFT_88341 [Guillardia theta CCMP2712]
MQPWRCGKALVIALLSLARSLATSRSISPFLFCLAVAPCAMSWSLNVGFHQLRSVALRPAKEAIISSSPATRSMWTAWKAMYHTEGERKPLSRSASGASDIRSPLRAEKKRRAASMMPLNCQKQEASSKPAGTKQNRGIERERAKRLATDLGLDGIFPVHKPQNFTSYDVVAKIRSMISRHLRSLQPELTRKGAEIKVGHGGTLDPMATGVLVIGVGSGTRKMDFFTKGRKAYEAVMQNKTVVRLCSPIGEVHPWEDLTDEKLIKVLDSYIGDILQRPPMYSAVKIQGVRAYELARKGVEVEMKPRPVRVHSIKLMRPFAAPDFHIYVDCGGGTYIRSLISDIALDLGTAAHMTKLVRTHQARRSIPLSLQPPPPPPPPPIRRSSMSCPPPSHSRPPSPVSLRTPLDRQSAFQGRFQLEDCLTLDDMTPDKIVASITKSNELL